MTNRDIAQHLPTSELWVLYCIARNAIQALSCYDAAGGEVFRHALSEWDYRTINPVDHANFGGTDNQCAIDIMKSMMSSRSVTMAKDIATIVDHYYGAGE